jgi:hypothetical protein
VALELYVKQEIILANVHVPLVCSAGIPTMEDVKQRIVLKTMIVPQINIATDFHIIAWMCVVLAFVEMVLFVPLMNVFRHAFVLQDMDPIQHQKSDAL